MGRRSGPPPPPPLCCQSRVLHQVKKEKKNGNSAIHFRLTLMSLDVTGLTPWRASGIKHRKNEVYIDVIESVNMLVSAKGTLLRADVEGQV